MTARRPFPKSYSLVVAISAGLFLLTTGNAALARHHHHHKLVHGTGSSHNPIVNCPSGRGGGTDKCGFSPR